MGRKRQVTDAEIAEWRERRARGDSLRDIAYDADRSPGHIYRYVDDIPAPAHGWKPKGLTLYDWDRIARIYVAERLSIPAVTQRFGPKQPNAREQLIKRGVYVPRQGLNAWAYGETTSL